MCANYNSKVVPWIWVSSPKMFWMGGLSFLWPPGPSAAFLQIFRRLMFTCPRLVTQKASQLKPYLQRMKRKELISVASGLPDWEFFLGKFSQKDLVALSSSFKVLWVSRNTAHPLSSTHLLPPKHTHTIVGQDKVQSLASGSIPANLILPQKQSPLTLPLVT